MRAGLAVVPVLTVLPQSVIAQTCARLEQHAALAGLPNTGPFGVLGLRIQRLDPDSREALNAPDPFVELVQSVEQGGAGAKAGIRPGDLVMAVDQCSITAGRDLNQILRLTQPGQAVEVQVLRAGQTVAVSAVLDPALPPGSLNHNAASDTDVVPVTVPMPPAARRAVPDLWRTFGAEGFAMRPEFARQMDMPVQDIAAVILSKVDPASNLSAKGLMRGDMILSAGFIPVGAPEDLQRVIDHALAKGRRALLLRVLRRLQNPVYIAVRLPTF